MPDAPSASRASISLRVQSSPKSTGLTPISPANRPFVPASGPSRPTVVCGLLRRQLMNQLVAVRLDASRLASAIRSARILVSAISGTIMVVAIPACGP